jgi:YidC/Oxa1 family membrane protein insertase
MDTKKLILAIVLSVAVLLVYQYFFMPKPVARPQAPAATAAVQPRSAEPAAANQGSAAPDIGSILGQGEPAVRENASPLPAVQEDVAAANEQMVTVDGSLFAAAFTNRGAGLTSFVLKKYNDDSKKPMDLVARSAKESNFYPFYFFSEKDDFSAILNKALFSYQGATTVRLGSERLTEVIFTFADSSRNLSATKKFIFSDNSYVIGLDFEVRRNGIVVADLPVVFGPDLENNDSKDRAMMMNLKIAAYANEKLESIEFAKLKTLPQAGQAFEKASGEKGSGFYWGPTRRPILPPCSGHPPRTSRNFPTR